MAIITAGAGHRQREDVEQMEQLLAPSIREGLGARVMVVVVGATMEVEEVDVMLVVVVVLRTCLC